MDFFERQDRARKRSRMLVVYFIAAVLLTIAAVYAVAAGLLTYLHFSAERADFDGGYVQPSTARWILENGGVFSDDIPWWDLELALLVIFGTSLLVMIGSSIKSYQYAKGGSAVAEMLGGRLIAPSTTDHDERRMLNIVEEMSIASGIPVPPVYLLEEDDSINAFAAGHDGSDTAVGVTRGAMKKLSRDEMQGVMAHEFSHIMYGDMRLNMRLTCLTHGILFISQTGHAILSFPFRTGGRMVLYSGGGGRNQGGAAMFYMALIVTCMIVGGMLALIGSIGYFAALAIKSAVSRQREFLADAAAVQFTRMTSGIAGALKKIAFRTEGSRLKSSHTAEAGHFLFGNGMSKNWSSAFSTHPPVLERILALEPNFDPTTDPVVQAKSVEQPPAAPAVEKETAGSRIPSILPLDDQLAEALGMGGARSTPAAGAAALVGAVGALDGGQLARTREMISGFSPELRQDTHESFGARAVVYGLLLSDDPEVRHHQTARLKQNADPAVLEEWRKRAPEMEGLPPNVRFALLDMSVPALRLLAPEQYRRFRENVDVLMEADGELCLFEYALRHMLNRHLAPVFDPGWKPRGVTHHSLLPVLPSVHTLIAAMAYSGQDTHEDAVAAFDCGAAQLNLSDTRAEAPGVEACGLERVDAALDELAGLTPGLKRNVLYAIATTAAHSGRLNAEEFQLLRAIGDALDCPIPPFVGELATT